MLATLTASQSKDVWYLMRGTGLTSLLLLTLTLTAGIAGVRRWSTDGWPRAAVAFLHRNVALLAVVFLAVHITSAMLDPYVSIGWLAAIVPFVAHWNHIWVGLGALALDVILALVATSLVRSHLSHRVWRGVHWAAYLSWPLALVHGFETGTDSTTGWARGAYVASILVVAVAVGWRVWRRPSSARTPSYSPVDRGLGAIVGAGAHVAGAHVAGAHVAGAHVAGTTESRPRPARPTTAPSWPSPVQPTTGAV